MKPSSNLAALIERYFTVRLMRQRNVSANTIASYRDTFRLLFSFAQARLRRLPSTLALDDLDAPFVGAFLTDLETKRGASLKMRNLRLTAIRSFDCSVIALWLGHELIETTPTYLHAHLALKEAALAKLKPYEHRKRTRFQPSDRLLAFLEAL